MKIFIFLFPFFITNISLAQLDQGSHQLGGTLRLLSDTRDNGARTRTSIDVIPAYGFFITDRFALGSGLGVQFFRNEIDANNLNSISKTTTFIINPFARYHFLISDNFFLFTQAEFNLMPGKNSREEVVGNETNIEKSNVFSYSIGIAPGFLFILSDQFAMEAGIGFIGFSSRASKHENADSWDNELRSFSLNFFPDNINLGLRYYF